MNMKRFRQMFEKINSFGKAEKGINRLAYSEEEWSALQYIKEICMKENFLFRRDEIGNIIIRRDGQNNELPAVATGSHLDTVYHAGKYDGVVGVVAGIEILRSLNDEKIETEYPLEVIIFACEESARFGMATIGSKAMTGLITRDDLIDLQDDKGMTFSDVIAEQNLTLSNVHLAERNTNELSAFIELHVEQGPILERDKKDIGIVTGIAAPTRYQLIINGKHAHSGSTPMDYRQDAFLTAAEISLYLEQLALEEKQHKTVATVGKCEIESSAMNVIPGLVKMFVDIRSINQSSKNRLIAKFEHFIKQVEIKRNVQVDVTKMVDDRPVLMNPDLTKLLVKSCNYLGYSFAKIPSGAGHDAMNMAQKYPTAVIFIPSRDGLSHHPDEYTSFDQIEKGIIVLKKTVLSLAKSVYEYKDEMGS